MLATMMFVLSIPRIQVRVSLYLQLYYTATNDVIRNQGSRYPHVRSIKEEFGEGFRENGHTARNILPSLL